MKKFLLVLLMITFSFADDVYMETVNGKIRFVSERVYNGVKVIVIENNITYIPRDMFVSKKD